MGFLLLVFPLAIQVISVIHIMRTGRDRTWIYVVVFLPLVGSIVYVLVELLPDLLSGRNARKVGAGVARIVNPGGKIRDLQARLDFSPTVENRMALAEAWAEEGEHGKAAELYKACLEGIHKNDRHIMSLIGRELQACGENARAREWFEKILSLRGSFDEDRDSLSYAMSLDALGENEKADAAYRNAAAGSMGLEAQYRHASFLRRTGRKDEADRLVSAMLQAFEQLPPYARRSGREWINAAKKEMI
jgi:hypothetical protein